ncbi:hypothetical protein JOD20_003853 [Herpetosiphon giganteus]|nr:hypothetical protein [Herpetosiphon giganteus]
MTQSSKKSPQRLRVLDQKAARRAASLTPRPLKPAPSTGQSLSTFRGRWAGDDQHERLAEVYQLRGLAGLD